MVLIFDEVSAAWREVCGGRHLKYGVYPDIAVFSKTLSNGFAMAAMVGVCDVMEAAQETFISTSYHTERVGPTAALATIKKFMRCNVQAVNSERGARVQRGWTAAAADAGLAVSVGGFAPWPAFSFRGHTAEGSVVLTTLFTQEMLKRGFLANTCVVVTFAHTNAVLEHYLRHTAEVFLQLAKWLNAARGDAELCTRFLLGPPKHSGWQKV